MERLVLFCEKFGQLIHSGVPIMEAFGVLNLEFADDRACIRAIQQMVINVENGQPLASGNEEFFSTPLSMALVSAGEKNGTLDYCLLRIAKVYEKELMLKKPGNLV